MIREYQISECVSFRKTKESYGQLSNMASGYILVVNDIIILSSEALYQCCRFPHLPDVQEKIIMQKSPMSAKMVSKPFRQDSRYDWEKHRIKIMKWCLRVKLAQNWEKFSKELLSTGDLPIVEDSNKDSFWGAKLEYDTFIGVNALGRLLMELRELIRVHDKEFFLQVPPVEIKDFLLLGKQINIVDSSSKECLVPGKVNHAESKLFY